MANVYAVSNGNWGTGATWNTGAVPTSADDVFSNNFTVNVDQNITVLSLRNTSGSGITAGGSFIFNTAGVTANVTASSPLLAGANNLIQVTAATGIVTMILGGNITPRVASSESLINHSGNCNFSLSAPALVGQTGAVNGTNVVLKSSIGILSVVANLVGSTVANGGNRCIISSAGVVSITGNITGGSNVNTNISLLLSGGSATITGTVTGGATSVAISSTVNVTIVGNVTAGVASAITSSSANAISVTGTVTASASAPAINMTNANGQVYLNGNMVNNNGKMAIFAPIVWLDKNNTTSAAFFTSGGVARTLYSADTVPNTPAANNVRSGTIYGAGNSLTGTLVMPVAANVRNGVTYDNGTVGTALFTTSQFITELSSSTTPIAVRMQNLCTPMILGELMEAFKR